MTSSVVQIQPVLLQARPAVLQTKPHAQPRLPYARSSACVRSCRRHLAFERGELDVKCALRSGDLTRAVYHCPLEHTQFMNEQAADYEVLFARCLAEEGRGITRAGHMTRAGHTSPEQVIWLE